MEDYSKGSAEDEDIQKTEPHEDDKVESARDIAVVYEDDSGCDEEEKLVSESPSVTPGIEPGDLDAADSPIVTEQATRDVEPGDLVVAELDAAASPILTEQATRDIEPGESDVAELDAADSPILTEQATRDSSELLLTDAGSKEPDEETTLPPALDTTNDSSVDASDNNAGVEDSLEAANVPVVETTDAGDGEVVDKPDIDESMENQSQPTVSVHRRLPRPTSCSSCCGLFKALWRQDDR
ncbi:hypothetical protein HRI_000383000 [Hibiscus trionum]|uniref:Uncharacterized protein n=1 Tax=Hibiscus trionum TaxID=183268 RepID=A0A9W7GY22_HIBTR|nr:hypothetical protein HRI_000383000 [Hibiscus trionum]